MHTVGDARSSARLPLWLSLALAAASGVFAPEDMRNAAFWAVQRLTQTVPDALWDFLSWLGDAHLTLALLAAVALPTRAHWCGATVYGGVIATIIVRAFKYAWPLPRPLGVLDAASVHVIGPALRASSFPSGHAATAFLLAACIALYAQRPMRDWRALAALALASAIGLSRIAVGAHWLGDVLAGAAVGGLCAWLGVCAAKRWPLHATTGGMLVLAAVAILLGVTLWWRSLPPLELWFARALGLAAIAAGMRTLWVLRRQATIAP